MKQPGILILILSVFYFAPQSAEGQVWKYAKSAPNAQIEYFTTDSVGNSYLCGTFYKSYKFDTDSVVGNSYAGAPPSIFLVKLDATGKLVWLHSIFGNQDYSTVNPQKITVNQNGELAIILAASSATEVFIGDISVPTNPDITLPVLAKIGKTGRVHWAHAMDMASPIDPEIVATDIILDEQGTCFATGYYAGGNAVIATKTAIQGVGSEYTSFVTRINEDSNIPWFRNAAINEGGSSAELKTTHIREIDDVIYVAGTFFGTRTYAFGGYSLDSSRYIDVFVAQYSKAGTANWVNQIRANEAEYAVGMEVLNNRDVILMGVSNSSTLPIGSDSHIGSGAYDLFLSKHSSLDGSPISSNIYNTLIDQHNSYDRKARLSTDRYNNIYIASEFEAASIFSGLNTVDNVDAGNSDVIIAKLDADALNPIWAKSISGAGNNSIESLTINHKGNIYICDTTHSAISISGTPITTNTSLGTMYCATINADDGTINYNYTQENISDNSFEMLHSSGDAYGNSYIAGIAKGSAASLEGHSLVQSGERGIVIGKYAEVQTITGVVENAAHAPVSEGYVKIYGYTYFQNSPLNDSVQIQPSGNFEFIDIPNGYYLVVAVPQGTVASTYIPTYFPSSQYWEFADNINIETGIVVDPLVITMLEPTELIGGTRLGGIVSEEDYLKNLKSSSYSKGKPETEATVVLAGNRKFEKADYDIITTVKADADGNFSFYNVEDGNYYIWVDMPGLPCDPHYITVSGNSYISNINYLITEEEVVQLGFPSYTSLLNNTKRSGISVYPNPAKDDISIAIKNFDHAVADIFNAKGQHLEHLVLTKSVQKHNINNLQAGNYFIRIMTDNKLVFEKITIVK